LEKLRDNSAKFCHLIWANFVFYASRLNLNRLRNSIVTGEIDQKSVVYILL
jgi:hypothetical protein